MPPLQHPSNHPKLKRWNSISSSLETGEIRHNCRREARKARDRRLDILNHCRRIDDYHFDNRCDLNLLSLLDQFLQAEAHLYPNSLESSFNSHANLFRQIASRRRALVNHLSVWFFGEIMSVVIYWFLTSCGSHLFMWHILDRTYLSWGWKFFFGEWLENLWWPTIQ